MFCHEWDLPATKIRELDIQLQNSSNKCAENFNIEFVLHNKNGKLSITMKGENLELLDDSYTITSDLMRRKFTRQIALHAATCTSECDFNVAKCHTVGCQMIETWKCIVCEK